jgi:3-oxoacyl-[acyl-carrier-protein] synthase III
MNSTHETRTSDLCVKAAQIAIENSNIRADELDLIVEGE